MFCIFSQYHFSLSCLLNIIIVNRDHNFDSAPGPLISYLQNPQIAFYNNYVLSDTDRCKLAKVSLIFRAIKCGPIAGRKSKYAITQTCNSYSKTQKISKSLTVKVYLHDPVKNWHCAFQNDRQFSYMKNPAQKWAFFLDYLNHFSNPLSLDSMKYLPACLFKSSPHFSETVWKVAIS